MTKVQKNLQEDNKRERKR